MTNAANSKVISFQYNGFYSTSCKELRMQACIEVNMEMLYAFPRVASPKCKQSAQTSVLRYRLKANGLSGGSL